MKTKLKMPKISDTANEMVVVEVLVSVGEQIRKDQVLFTVETDKSVVEIPSPFDGTIFEILVSENGEVNIGDQTIIIES